jgi:two-component system nitrate/nitrite sensor histidine kinase NarX
MRAELQMTQQFLASALDSLSANIAILDQAGTIVAVNASWRRFADDNGLEWPDYGLGRNYLAVVEAASVDSAEGAIQAAEGMGELMAGQRDQLYLEYPCHSPDEKRWFEMRATPFRTGEGVWLVTAHEDITLRRLAEQALHEARETAEADRSQEQVRRQVVESQRDVTLEALHEAERKHREHLEQLVDERTSELIEANQKLEQEISERARAEEALRESEEKFRNVAEQSPNMIFINNKGRVVYANKICEDVMGYTREELHSPDFDFLTLIAPESLDLVKDSFDKHMRGGDVPPYEYALVTKGGGKLEVIITPRLITYEGESAILGTVTDITARKQAEEVLRESEARFWDLYHNAPNAYFTVGADGSIHQCNKRAAELLGFPVQELVGKPVFELYADTPQGREKAAKVFQRFTAGESITDEELQMGKADGTPVWISLTVNAVRDAEGNIIESRSMVVDITERKRIEGAFHEAMEAAEAARNEEHERRQEAERRRQVAEGLGDVLTALNSNQSLEEVLDLIATQARQLLDTRAVGIYGLGAEVGTFAIEASKGLLITYVAGSNIPIGQESLRQAMVSSQPVAVPDVGTFPSDVGVLALDVRRRRSAGAWADLYRAWLAVPIVSKDEVYGGMLLYYAEPRMFSEDEIELAVVFADQAALAIQNSRLRDQIQQAAASAERGRLARDLHDAVTQTLFSASLIAEAMPRVWERHPEQGRSGLDELRQLTRDALAEMRTLLVELRPAALTEKPLDELLRQLTEATTSRTRVPIALAVEGDSSLEPGLQVALYRIAQEALNNIAKHARASQASVDLHCQPGRGALRISDDGCGFDANNVLPDRLGMGIMRERAEHAGANLRIKSQPGDGTQIIVNWQNMGEERS